MTSLKPRRFRDLLPTAPYYQHWVCLRRWTSIGLWTSLLFLGLEASSIGRQHPAVFFVLMGFTLAAIGLYRMIWPCPRCRQPFYGWWDRAKCRHCGLPEFAPNAEACL